MKHLIVSLHDFHPGTHAAVKEQIDTLTVWGVRNFSILVVPHFHHQKMLKDNAAALAYLGGRHAVGDDLVIHGYYHDRVGQGGGSFFWTKLYSANEAEFLDLSDGEVRHRLTRALTLWEENGWRADGFIAPAWLMPEEQDLILKRMNFTYTTRLKYWQNLRTLKVTATQSLCYSTRARWRRALSLRWNQWLFARLLKTKDVIRLSLHPRDLQFEAIRQQIHGIVETALTKGYQPITYAAYSKAES
ncbi:MAG: polysaccharide deacetylase family protein [Verrucomicrobiales bacterium]|jgi:predicted deacetylase|nr:polysaccharide deacetylase family protein [Verrucomicrobiales bacterium]